MKRKIIKTKNGFDVRKIGNFKRFFEGSDGMEYFILNGRRKYLSEIMRLTFCGCKDVEYTENKEKHYILGAIPVFMDFAILVEITEKDGYQGVQLYEYVRGL